MGNSAEKMHICDLKENELFFEIPPYQRLYEWESNEITMLLDDMKKAFDDKKENYFIGTITTSEKETAIKEKAKFVLIDGQQRLTTLWFIGFYLASLGCADWQNFIVQDDKVRIAMPIRDDEERVLKNLANKIKSKDTNDNSKKFADYLPNNIHEKIIEAFRYIESWFKNVEKIKENEVKDFAKFIYKNVCFVFVTLAENTDLNRFFVRMNNRGVQLEKHEILKARLLNKIRESNPNSNEWQKYAKIWDLCSDMNKYIFQSNDSEIYQVKSIIDFSTFLLHCYKVWVVGQENENAPQDIQIGKDKLLDMIKPNEWDSKKAECFIKSMLCYRVLFDSFVIKFTAKTNKDINDKENSYKIKRLDFNSKDLINSNLKDLEMIQNYLRVARPGERQNYHHWLTPFLQKLHETNLINYDLIKFESWNPNEICKAFENKDDSKQDELVRFLENLDRKLAISQLSKSNESGLLDIANNVLKDCNVDLDDKEKNLATKFDDLKNWDFLNNGTGTPYYWFYRLEYYLWKWGQLDNEQFEKGCKDKFGNKFDDLQTIFNANLEKFSFKNVVKAFYFRNLGSIEHFSAKQRKEPQKEWGIPIDLFKLDMFGNLALISQNFNSSLSNELEQVKKYKVVEQLKRGRLESLKYFIMCASLNEVDEWTYDNAQAHQNQMLEILTQSLKK